MLTAWDIQTESILALPDYEEGPEIDTVRQWARAGRVVCPVCREKLWLRVGEKRCAHLAHRLLADCPQANISVAIIETRRLLYRFFQDRIQRGKLAGPIELEPTVSGLPEGTRVDLILRREIKKPVAIVLLDAGLKPNHRWLLRSAVQQNGCIFRPVFLTSTLKPKTDFAGIFLLNPTQRDLTHNSVFGVSDEEYGRRATLHFVDQARAHWISLRGLHLEHSPQVYRTQSIGSSSMTDLLWSESQSEWTHPGESRAKEEALPAAPTLTPLPPQRPSRPSSAFAPALQASPEVDIPSWLTGGLVCKGCQIRTNAWQTATPGQDRCICVPCFVKGVR